MRNFPQNTLAEYTVQLPQPIDLSRGRWEIGLSEIQFFKSWYNLKDAYITLAQGDKTYKASLPDGFYESNKILIDQMNYAIKCHLNKDFSEGFQFSYLEITRSLQIKILKGVTGKIDFSDNLKTVLNAEDLKFEVRCNDDDATIATSKNPIRLRSIFNLMVYTDVASSNIVGDVEAPLLRTVPVTEGHWRYQSTTFTKIQYIPISQKELRTISFYIYTDYGEPVPFTDGKTIVTVDLRKSDLSL